MNKKTLITGGPLFDGESLHESGSVLFENGVILDIFPTRTEIDNCDCIDVKGDLIMPGIVDLHSDSLERNIEKRKGVFFDVGFALLNLDRQLAASGITSFCHAISFADKELGLRSPGEAEKCVRTIKNFNLSGQALIKHNIHIRYEVGSEVSHRKIKQLISDGLVDILSIMDHTPGQGQFKSMESYIKFHSSEYALSDDEIIQKANEKQTNNNLAWLLVIDLVDTVKKAGIPLLSHDDDTEDKVAMVRNMGVDASEFPVTIEAAKKAFEAGMKVYMGAPNLVRNLSTNGNLKTSDVIKQKLCTGLVSDYYPESLFQASFIAAKYTGNLSDALSKVTSGPGRFLSIDPQPGFLKKGTDADIILVNMDYTWPHVARAFVRGKCVFQI